MDGAPLRDPHTTKTDERVAGAVEQGGLEAADGVESDWPEWARAAAVLQRWLEAAGRDADAERKLGYLHCTVEAQKVVPTAIRHALPQAVARMLKEHGFAE